MIYTEAARRLRGRRSLRMPGRYTTLVQREHGIIALHVVATNVVTWRPCGAVELNSGGWRTVMTKNRINDYAPGVKVWQYRGIWSIELRGVDGSERRFTDGMRYKAGRWME
jgi:hypothetical protein